jgi:hypothetical protein
LQYREKQQGLYGLEASVKSIKIRSGGVAYILEQGEECRAGEVCFFPGEWELAQKMGKAAATDSDNLKSFWKDLLEKKRSIPGYTLFSEVCSKEKPEQQRLSFNDLGIKHMTQAEKPTPAGLKIAKEIIEMLRKKNEAKNGLAE